MPTFASTRHAARCAALAAFSVLLSAAHAQSLDPFDRAERPTGPYTPPALPMRTSRPFLDRGPGPVSVQVNTTATGQNILGDAANEPSLAIDPIDPARIAVGWRQFDTVTNSFRQAGRAYSRDAGRTWIPAAPLEPGIFRSDPVLKADADGRIHYLSLSVPAGSFSCELFTSLDGGATFGPARTALGGDKEWLAIDTRPGPARNMLYQHWTPSFSRSFDLGLTWTAAQGGNPIWGQSAVGIDGTLYIIGRPNSGFSPVAFARIPNPSGITPPVPASSVVPLPGAIRFNIAGSPNPGGLLSQPLVVVDYSTGPRRGWIYAACALGPQGSDPADVYFSRSTDNAQTWSTPVRVNSSVPTANDWQWFAAMSVAPNGRIDLVFNDTRESQNAAISRLYYTSSIDGGDTWSPDSPVSPSFNSTVGFPQQNKIGDYSDISSDNLGASVIYSATFNNEQDVWFLRLGPRLCPGDFNRDGSVTVQDIFDFLAAYFSGDITADLSRDFSVAVQDIFTFLERWFAPCTQ